MRAEFRLPHRHDRGLSTFIPYVGSLTGLVLSAGVALVQFWPDWVMIVRRAGDLLHRAVPGGQHPVAQARGRGGGAASGVADVRAVRLRLAVRLRRPAARRADGGDGRACWRASPCGNIWRARSMPAARCRCPVRKAMAERTRKRPASPASSRSTCPSRSGSGAEDFLVSPSNETRLRRAGELAGLAGHRDAAGRPAGLRQEPLRRDLGRAQPRLAAARGRPAAGERAAPRLRRGAGDRGLRPRARPRGRAVPPPQRRPRAPVPSCC